MFDFQNFEDFQFEIIDVSVTGTPDMHITRNGVTFTRRLIEDMGYPQYVKPMLDANNKAFALKACKADSEGAMRFSKPKGEQKRSFVTSIFAIRQVLRTLMGEQWKEENRYHLTGSWFPEAKAMIFDLNAAKELPPFRVEKAQYRQHESI